MTAETLFCDYFSDWVSLYKEGAVRPVTLNKYHITLKRLVEIAPTLKMSNIDKRTYQGLINEYAKTHERQTTMDWHTQLKGVILDAVDEGYIKVDPTRKVVIKGKPPSEKKLKFLSVAEMQALLSVLDLRIVYKAEQSKNGKYHSAASWDWLILLLAKTGLRFSEALGLTPGDFDFKNNLVHVTKTWNYKCVDGGFTETKNKSSKRTVLIDDKLSSQFRELTNKCDNSETPVFVNGRVFNSVVNSRLKTLCGQADIPIISVHGLRHTHASLLLHSGISIASIARRLGHANTTTTQETYLHIIKELEAKDNEKILSAIAEF
ncbi:MAG: site-specific integrase [Defluviitaleaceae bacterium]|nr:site-specific integrase [Defluviitaleaceae bacterium]MCL2261660.1 site-specific integrase [Defluviitaleaceae bacterium]